MPDKRQHRGCDPQDPRLFADGHLESLRKAVGDLSWLLTRGYAEKSALKLVGDRYALAARQRLAVRRCTCNDEELRWRAETRTTLDDAASRRLAIDGYNLLITVEGALAGAPILVGRDGCLRDLAGIHGTYRRVAETQPALELIFRHVVAAGVRHVVSVWRTAPRGPARGGGRRLHEGVSAATAAAVRREVAEGSVFSIRPAAIDRSR